MFELVAVAEFERREILGVDADDCEVERALGRVDFRDVEFLAVGELDRDGPGLADDVQIRGDQAVFRDDESGAEALLFAVAAGEGDDDDRFGNLGGQLLDGEAFLGNGGGRLSEESRWRDQCKDKEQDESPHMRAPRNPVVEMTLRPWYRIVGLQAKRCSFTGSLRAGLAG